MFENNEELQKLLKGIIEDKKDTSSKETIDKYLLDLKTEILKAKDGSKYEAGHISKLGMESDMFTIVDKFMDLIVKNTDYTGNDVVEMILYSISKFAFLKMVEEDGINEETLSDHTVAISTKTLSNLIQYKQDNNLEVNSSAYLISILASILSFTMASMTNID